MKDLFLFILNTFSNRNFISLVLYNCCIFSFAKCPPPSWIHSLRRYFFKQLWNFISLLCINQCWLCFNLKIKHNKYKKRVEMKILFGQHNFSVKAYVSESDLGNCSFPRLLNLGKLLILLDFNFFICIKG